MPRRLPNLEERTTTESIKTETWTLVRRREGRLGGEEKRGRKTKRDRDGDGDEDGRDGESGRSMGQDNGEAPFKSFPLFAKNTDGKGVGGKGAAMLTW